MTFILVIDGHASEQVYAAIRDTFNAQEENGQLRFHHQGRDILCLRFVPPEDPVFGSYLLIQTCTALLGLIDYESKDMLDQQSHILERCRIARRFDRTVKLGLFPGDNANEDYVSFRSSIEKSASEIGAQVVDIDIEGIEHVISELIDIASPDQGSCYLL